MPLEAHQDLPDTIEALGARAEGGHVVLQGLRYRSLSYFFGPFVPLVVLGVPGEDR